MIEIAGIFKKYGSSYLSKYSTGMLPSHTKAFDDILKCRTPIMGGKVYYCPDCKKYEYSYHSCGNRNCPKCQNDKAELWLEKNNKLLLPVNHFMITFTLPGELRSFARSNQKLFYELLFKCSSNSIESQTNQWKIMNLGTDEFIRRFLQHVLPSGFVKVRYYGLFASANRSALSMVRMLFECNDTVKKKKTNNAGLFKCPVCKKEMIVAILIPRPVRRSFNEVGPSRRFNKAPPQMNISFDNLSFNRCA